LIPLSAHGRAFKSYILILTLIFSAAFLAGILAPSFARQQVTEAFRVVADNYRGLGGGKLFFTILLHNVMATIILVISVFPVIRSGTQGFGHLRYGSGLSGERFPGS
jgi:hypothetical protein